MTPKVSHLSCALCQTKYRLEDYGSRVACDCGGLLDVVHDLTFWQELGGDLTATWFDHRRKSRTPADSSGVWRFRELVLPALAEREIVTRGEGNTRLYSFRNVDGWLRHDGVLFKHEGENPTGSFKDRGLTVAMSWAKKCGARFVACASTGNTAAAVASYASLAGIPAVILIPDGATALGKVSQSLAYGAITVKVKGDFDQALKLVMSARERLGLTVLNSVNPFRLEGQKTIVWEALEQLGWDPPAWIVVPGGNLGNTSAFGKALAEAHEIGLISRLPRLAVVQAAGAAPFYRSYRNGWRRGKAGLAQTVATAIKIGDPVNFDKAVRAVRFTGGVVVRVTDCQIMAAKAVIDSDGVGAEPASCATAAGIKKLMAAGVIRHHDRVLAILTGHLLKDPDATIGYHSGTLAGASASRANAPVVIEPTLHALEAVLKERGRR